MEDRPSEEKNIPHARGHGGVRPYYMRPEEPLDAWNAEKNLAQMNGTGVPTEGMASESRTKSWRELFTDYTQYSTLHGVAYTTQQARFSVRRVVWTIIVVCAVGGFLYYIADRVNVYLRFDTNVNVIVNYAEKVEFPAVTICNQNPFKLTSAVYGGWYDSVLEIINDTRLSEFIECEDSEFMCKSNRLCIPKDRVCDLFPDCEDSSDEVDCGNCGQIKISTIFASETNATIILGTYKLISDLLTQHSPHKVYAKKVFSQDYLQLELHNESTVSHWRLVDGGGKRVAHSEILVNSSFGEIRWVSYLNESFSLNMTCEGLTVVKQDIESLANTDASQHITLKQLYEQGSHNKSEFFIFDRCRWKGTPCGSKDFIVSFTDQGLCHTFIPKDYVEKSGPGFGLSLTLNVEQFEYVKDSRTGVGIKMLLHDHNEAPFMQEHAIAISPGLNSLVSVERTELNSLEDPWGNCSEKQLTYYDKYSLTNCILDEENKVLRDGCDCIDLYMQNTIKNGNESICTVDQYVKCAVPEMKAHHSRGQPDCKQPCNQKLYVPSLSFSTITINNDQLSQNERKQMREQQRRLKDAREINFRIRDDSYRSTMRALDFVLEQTWETYRALDTTLEILKSETADIECIGGLVNFDCIEHNSHLQNISVSMGKEVVQATSNMLSHLLLNVSASTNQLLLQIEKSSLAKEDVNRTRNLTLSFMNDVVLEVNRKLIVALETLNETLTGLHTQTLKSGLAMLDPFKQIFNVNFQNVLVSLYSSSSITWEKYTNYGVNRDTVRNNLTDRFDQFASTLDRVPSSDIEALIDILNVTYIFDEFVLETENFTIPLGRKILPYLEKAKSDVQVTSFEYVGQLLQSVFSMAGPSYPFTLRDNFIDPLLQYIRSNCSWCISKKDERLIVLLQTYLLDTLCPGCTSNMHIDELCQDDVMQNNGLLSDFCRMNETMAAVANALEISLGDYLLHDSIYDEVVANITHITYLSNSLSQQLQSATELPVFSAYQYATEFLTRMTPKCQSELRKLYNEYIDVNTRTQIFVRDSMAYLQDYYYHFSSLKLQYIDGPRNLSLVGIRDNSKFDETKNYLSSKFISVESLLNDRSIAINRTADHINQLYYWLNAQLPTDHLVEHSKFWQRFNIKSNVSIIIPEKSDDGCNGGIPIEEKFALNSVAVEKYWKDKTDTLEKVNKNLQNQLQVMLLQVEDTQKYLDEFNTGNSVSEAFYKKNFIQMDVFYKELTERKVVHQKAYEYPALLSEIGGLMGLLLGASVITILEFVDVILNNGFDKCLRPKRNMKINHNCAHKQ